MVTVLKTDQNNPSSEDLEVGAEVIRRGGLVVFPTETVYGLGANALSEEACAKIFKAKERPSDNPLIVHICSIEMLTQVVSEIPVNLRNILEKIWPGPITLLLPKSDNIPDLVTGGSELVAVRMPDNPLALGLIKAANLPIAAPSANISTRPSITDSHHAIEELGDKVDLIYDSGKTPHGLESTIIDLSETKPVLLRTGSMNLEELREVFGDIEVTDFARGLLESQIPRAPGMKYRHYSPNKNLYLLSSTDLAREVSADKNLTGRIAILATTDICQQSVVRCIDLGSENDLESVGRNLFSSLRYLEQLTEEAGVIMPFPEHGKGLAIMNRIRKASTGIVSTKGELEKLIFQ